MWRDARVGIVFSVSVLKRVQCFKGQYSMRCCFYHSNLPRIEFKDFNILDFGPKIRRDRAFLHAFL